MSTSDNTTPPTGMGSPPNNEAQQSAPTPLSSPPEEKSPPYNLWFACTALAIAVIAYALTMLLFRNLFTDAQDAAVVTGALGALFTLIGTVAGAYFGIKRSSDTEDKGRATERAANERTEEANKQAKTALGALGSDKWENLRERRLL